MWVGPFFCLVGLSKKLFGAQNYHYLANIGALKMAVWGPKGKTLAGVRNTRGNFWSQSAPESDNGSVHNH